MTAELAFDFSVCRASCKASITQQIEGPAVNTVKMLICHHPSFIRLVNAPTNWNIQLRNNHVVEISRRSAR